MITVYKGPLHKMNLQEGTNFVEYRRNLPTGIPDSRWRELRKMAGFAVYEEGMDTISGKLFVSLPMQGNFLAVAIAVCLPVLKRNFPTCQIEVTCPIGYEKLIALMGCHWIASPDRNTEYYRRFDLTVSGNPTKFTRASTFALPWHALFYESTGLLDPAYDVTAKDADLSKVFERVIKSEKPILIGDEYNPAAFDERAYNELAKDSELSNGVKVIQANDTNTGEWLLQLLAASRVVIVGDPTPVMLTLLLGKPIRQFVASGYRSLAARQYANFGHAIEQIPHGEGSARFALGKAEKPVFERKEKPAPSREELEKLADTLPPESFTKSEPTLPATDSDPEEPKAGRRR